jgi:hypothetical protein
MSAAQQPGGDYFGVIRPPYGGVCLADDPPSFRLRPPPKFYCLAETESLFPTTPPGFLTMPEDYPIDRHAPTEADDLKPSTLPPPPESTTDPSSVMAEATRGDSYFASAARDFRDALVELRETRREIADGFRHQGADLHFIRHELQGFGQRLTTVESSTRDLRGEVADLKLTVRSALERIEALETELERRKLDSAPPAPSTGA